MSTVMNKLADKWHQYLAAGLLLLVLYIFYQLFIEPLVNLAEDEKSRYYSLIDKKNRYEDIASRLDDVKSQQNKYSEIASLNNSVLKADSLDMAQEAFQQAIINLTKNNHISVRSIKPLVSPKEIDQNNVALQMQLSMTHEQLESMLLGIEQLELLIFVDQITIEPSRQSRMQNQKSSPIQLEVSMVLSALWIKQA